MGVNGSYEQNRSVHLDIGGNENVNVTGFEIASIVDASFVYPKYKSMKDKELKPSSNLLSFKYKCDDVKCGIAAALIQIKANQDLKRLGVKEISEVVVDTIERYPGRFLPAKVGGYVLQSMGIPFLYLERDNADLPGNPDTPVGFTDLIEVRRRLIHQSSFEKVQRIKVIDTVMTSLAGAGGIAVMGMLALPYILKKLRP